MRRFVVGLVIFAIALTSSATHASDQQIAETILSQLQVRKEAGELEGFGIKLNVEDGVVWMKGYVSTPAQQKLALDVARYTRDVKQVVNDIEVRGEETARTEVQQPQGLLSQFGRQADQDAAPSGPQTPDREKTIRQPQGLLAGFLSRGDAAEDASPKSEKQPAVSESSDASAGRNAIAGPVAPLSLEKSATETSKPGETDQQIGSAIIKQLKEQQAQGKLKGFTLDLTVKDGSAWVKGTVVSKDQQTLILETARRVAGVKEVVNDIQVTSPQVDAVAQEGPSVQHAIHRTGKEAEARTASQPRVSPATPLMLQGSGNPSDKPLEVPSATEIAKSEPAEQELEVPATPEPLKNANPLRNGSATPQPLAESAQEDAASLARDDQAIIDEVTAKLREQKDAGNLKGFTLDLQSEEGVLWMTGSVSSEEQQQLVLDAGRWTPGVKKVINQITIKGAGKSDDAAADANDQTIAQDIAGKLNELKQQGALQGFGIKVNSTNGVVWLSGQVASQKQRQMVLDAARYTKGVAKVVNDVTLMDDDASSQVAQQPTQTPEETYANGIPRMPMDEPAAPPARDIEAEIAAAYARGKNAGTAEATAMAMQQRPRSSYYPNPYLAPSNVPALPGSNAEQVSAASGATEPASAELPAKESIPNPYALKGNPGMPLAIGATPPRTSYANPYGSSHAASASYKQGIPRRPLQHSGMPILAAPLAAPLALGHAVHQMVSQPQGAYAGPTPMPVHMPGSGHSVTPARYDHPQMPGYAWPSYASHPNYGAVTYPRQYSPSAWPYIGPFHPYPQVPLGWRKVTLEWDDGWWMLDFKDK